MDDTQILAFISAPDTTPYQCGVCPVQHPRHQGWVAREGAPYASYTMIGYPELLEVYVDVAFGAISGTRFQPSAVFGCKVAIDPATGAPGYVYLGSTMIVPDPAAPINVPPEILHIHSKRDEFWQVVGFLATAEPLMRHVLQVIATSAANATSMASARTGTGA